MGLRENIIEIGPAYNSYVASIELFLYSYIIHVFCTYLVSLYYICECQALVFLPGLIASPTCVVGRVHTYDQHDCCVQLKYIFEYYFNRTNVVNLQQEK